MDHGGRLGNSCTDCIQAQALFQYINYSFTCIHRVEYKVVHDQLTNSVVGPFDIALPGYYPVLDEECLDLALRAAHLFGCQVRRKFTFDRKHYNYPDLPHGYQITQFREPYAYNGSVRVNEALTVPIEKIQIEMDTGKRLQEANIIDMNRAGVGLLEIVTPPSLRSSLDSVAFAKRIQESLKHAKVCEGNLEFGQFRIDVNVSVTGPRAPPEAGPLGQRVEIKNLNSFTALSQAIDYEAKRQIDILEGGTEKSIQFETRGFDPVTKKTFPLRGKETKSNYRFIRDHDIPEIIVDDKRLARVISETPLTREQMSIDLKKKYPELTENQIEKLLEHDDFKSLFDEISKLSSKEIPASFIFNWISTDIVGALHRRSMQLDQIEINHIACLSDLLKALHNDLIARNSSRAILDSWLIDSSKNPISLAKSLGLAINNSDESELDRIVEESLSSEPEKVAQVREGGRSIDYFMGPLMKQLRGKVTPQRLRVIILEVINKS